MWTLETSSDAFQGRRLWLRPGKQYLIGRTSSEQSAFVITHKTISRKHLTITVDPVQEGHAQSLSSRSRVTIEDLKTSKGTFVEGESIQNQIYVVSSERIEFTMGKCPDIFRIIWIPIVLTYSFTSREMKNDPLTTLRADLEQLDIKFTTEYNVKATTHVVSKKRNTSKGLQALINGKYIVSSTFTDALVAAAASAEGDASALEQDFQGAWPYELDHLPPRGTEVTQNPASDYAPDFSRIDVFAGYTFIFYDKSQWDNLLAPITNGKGKALHYDVVPNETEVNDFVRYVKSVAGEKGLGSFEDGSEGKGAVVVRYLPAKGDDVPWYTEFITAVSRQLDHRAIEQKEFLEAILLKDAQILRRALPVASQPQEAREASNGRPPFVQRAATQDVEMGDSGTARASSQEPSQFEPQQPARRARGRRPATKRFKGFDDDDDDDMPVIQESAPIPESVPEKTHTINRDDDYDLFVSQGSAVASQEEPPQTQRATRKRRGGPLHDDDDIMDEIAPAAAAAKRRRIARGEEPVLKEPPLDAISADDEPQLNKLAAKPKKIKKEIDVLDEARKARERIEERARAEQEDLDHLPEGINLAEIRKLAIVEEMPLRTAPAARAKDRDGGDSRWDPRWNGRKNFKRFRARGEVAGRPVHKVIVALEQVKAKEFGIGDEYWFEDDNSAPQADSQAPGATASQPAGEPERQPQGLPTRRQASRRTVSDDSSSDEDDRDSGHISLGISELEQSGRPRSSRATTQRSTTSQAASTRSQGRSASGQKRSALASMAEQPAKRARPTRGLGRAAAASEDSDEDVGFRFGKRRR